MTQTPKAVIIGLDGVPFDMIEDFAENGIMPHTAELISKGIFKPMRSSIPEVSSVAWSSMITGQNPGRHGIFGFTDLHPNSYRMRFPNYHDLKAPPFWDQWEGKSVIINVPSTYPVKPMNGVLISGFVSIDFEKSVYPSTLVPDLKRLDYRLDVDSQKAHRSMDEFLEDVDKTLDARIEAYRHLWDNGNWQTFMLIFTGTDRLMHFLWNAYEDKSHNHHAAFIDHFRKIDGVVGEIRDKISDNDVLIMLSDHGFEKLETNVNMSYFLRQKGFLKFQPNQEIRLGNMSAETKAFALDPARIYLHYKDRYPLGGIQRDDVESLLSRLEERFFFLEVNGRKVIKEIYRKSEIYSGPYLQNAPDLVLVAEEGFNLKANLRDNQLTNKDNIFTGKHRLDNAFLVVSGNVDNDVILDNPTIADVKTFIEKSSGFLQDSIA